MISDDQAVKILISPEIANFVTLYKNQAKKSIIGSYQLSVRRLV